MSATGHTRSFDDTSCMSEFLPEAEIATLNIGPDDAAPNEHKTAAPGPLGPTLS
jgi:hypothetical protein